MPLFSYRSRSLKLLVATIVLGAILLVAVQNRGVTLKTLPGLQRLFLPNATATHSHFITASPTTPPPNYGSRTQTTNVTMSLMASDRTTVVVRPERVYPAADVSNVFVSILTVPKLHNSRLSYQLMSWIQSFDPKQVL